MPHSSFLPGFLSHLRNPASCHSSRCLLPPMSTAALDQGTISLSWQMWWLSGGFLPLVLPSSIWPLHGNQRNPRTGQADPGTLCPCGLPTAGGVYPSFLTWAERPDAGGFMSLLLPCGRTRPPHRPFSHMASPSFPALQAFPTPPCAHISSLLPLPLHLLSLRGWLLLILHLAAGLVSCGPQDGGKVALRRTDHLPSVGVS